MPSRLFETVLILVVVSMAQPGWSQVSALPTDVQNVLAAVGPTWGHDLRGNVETTAKAFIPLLKAAPKDGITVKKNLPYGKDRFSTSTNRKVEPARRSSSTSMAAPMSVATAMRMGRCTAISSRGSVAKDSAA